MQAFKTLLVVPVYILIVTFIIVISFAGCGVQQVSEVSKFQPDRGQNVKGQHCQPHVSGPCAYLFLLLLDSLYVDNPSSGNDCYVEYRHK